MPDNNPDAKPFQIDKLPDQMKDPSGIGIISDEDRVRISEKIFPELPTYKDKAQQEAERIFPNASSDDVLKAADTVDRGKVLPEDARGLDTGRADKLTTFKPPIYYYDKYLTPELIQQVYGEAQEKAKEFLEDTSFKTDFYKKFNYSAFKELNDVGVLMENQRKVAELAEKTHLPEDNVRDFMSVRLAVAAQILSERESRYSGFVLRAQRKLQPDKFDIENIIVKEQDEINRRLNDVGLESFPPKGDAEDPKVRNWNDLKGNGKDLADQKPKYFGRIIDAYREAGSLNVKHDAPSEQSIWPDVLSASQIKQMGREMLAGAKDRLPPSLPERMPVVEVADFPEAVREISSASRTVTRHTVENIADMTGRKRKMAIFSSILANRLYPNSKIEQQEQTLKNAMEIEPLLTGATESVKFNESQEQNISEIMGLQMDEDRRNAEFYRQRNNLDSSQWAEFYTRAADRIENALKLLLHSSIEE